MCYVFAFWALLADQGIDDDSALKISNMAALPNGMPPGTNAAIKAKISSNNAAHAPKGTSAEPSQGSPVGYDPNAYLYDANSWPEYTIHDSDYSNFRSVEMNNMNGENTDMPNYDKMVGRRPSMPGYQNMGNEEEMELEGPKFPHENPAESEFNDEVKQENGEALQQRPPSEGKQAAPVAGGAKLSADSGNKGQSESNSKPAPGPSQQSPQTPAAVKAEDNAQTAKDAPSQKLQQKPQEQQQPQAKATPVKLAESVAQAAASLPPKAIASLVSSLVGGRKVVGATAGKLQGQNQSQGQIQKNVAGSASQSLIPQDINPAEEQTQTATQLHKVEKPKKH